MSKTGIIEYGEMVQLGAELIHAIFSKNQALKELKDKEEESKFQANLMLYIDEIHDLNEKVVNECRKLDEEDNYYVSNEQMKAILEGQAEILNTQEREQILELIGGKYPSNKVKYLELKELFKEFVMN